MANNNPITNWILDNKEITKPVFTQFDWPDRYMPGVFDFCASIEIRGAKTYGRGLATNPELAIEKASAEAIERWICKMLKIPSVGVAVSGETSSFNHGKSEALERYYLSAHLHLKQAFATIPVEILEGAKKLRLLLTKFQTLNKKSQVSFYRLNTPLSLCGVLCAITIANNHKSIFGFSLSTTFEKALSHSFYEALPNFAAFRDHELDKNVNTNINSKIANDGGLSISDLPWHLQDSYSKQLSPLFDLHPTVVKYSSIPQPEIEIEHINISDFHEFNGCPIEPIRARIISGFL